MRAREEQTRGVDYRQDFTLPASINRIPYALFALKVALVAAGYVVLIHYLLHALVSCMLPAQKARILAEALPYIRAFHGTTLVIRLGGRAMVDPALKAGFARDVALLRLVGMKPIVVHGGGWRIDEMLRQTGIEPRREGGLRVTDERTLTMIEMVLCEQNQELAGLVNRLRRPRRRPRRPRRPLHPRTPHHRGRRRHAAATWLRGRDRKHRSRPDRAPVVAQLHADRDADRRRRRRYVVSPELGSAGRASRAHAPRGEAGADDQRRRRAWARRQAPLRPGGRRGRGAHARPRDRRRHAPRVQAALDAVRDGVRSVHIIDGGVPSALLLEVLTAEGVGTALRSASGPEFFADSRAYLLAQ